MEFRIDKVVVPTEDGLGSKEEYLKCYEYMNYEDTALYDLAVSEGVPAQKANEIICQLLLRLRDYCVSSHVASKY